MAQITLGQLQQILSQKAGREVSLQEAHSATQSPEAMSALLNPQATLPEQLGDAALMIPKTAVAATQGLTGLAKMAAQGADYAGEGIQLAENYLTKGKSDADQQAAAADIKQNHAVRRGQIEEGFQPLENLQSRAQDYLTSKQSSEQQQELAAVQNAKGFVDSAKAIVTNPGAALDLGMQSAGDMLLGGEIARGAYVAKKAAGVLAGMAEEAAAKVAIREASKAGVKSEALSSAGHGANSGGQDAQITPEFLQANSPEYRAMIADGVDPETARYSVMADKNLMSGLLSGTGTLAGGAAFKPFDSLVGKIAGEGVESVAGKGWRAGARELARDVPNEMLKEGGQEVSQSGAEQLGSNIASLATTNENQDLMQGVPESMTQGALLGAGTGGVMQAGANAIGMRSPTANPAAHKPAQSETDSRTVDLGASSSDLPIAATVPQTVNGVSPADAIAMGMPDDQTAISQPTPIAETSITAPIPDYLHHLSALSDHDLAKEFQAVLSDNEEANWAHDAHIEKLAAIKSESESRHPAPAAIEQPAANIDNPPTKQKEVPSNGQNNQAETQTETLLTPQKNEAATPTRAQLMRRVDPNTDELQTAIAKLGGISRDDAKAQGIDPAHFGERRGILPVFSKDGMSFDAMAEALSQHGYLPQDYSANDLLDKVSASQRGAAHYTPTGFESRAEKAAIDKAVQDNNESELAKHVTIDGPEPAQDHAVADAWIDAANQGVSWEALHGALNQREMDTGEALSTIRQMLEEHINENKHAKRAGDSEAANESRNAFFDTFDETGAERPAKTKSSTAQEVKTDLFGDVPVAQQSIADRQRELDTKRNGTRDVPADIDGGLFSNQHNQADLTDAPTANIDAAAHEAATSPHNDLPSPTDAQKEAGNYKKGHVNVHGLDITIENPRGSDRTGRREDGSTWSHTMSDHYGYITGHGEGADGDHPDVYIGENPSSKNVFIVDQVNQKDGSFDEHKIMLGFKNKAAAITAYQSNFDAGWKVGPITSMTMDNFKEWLKGDTTKEAAKADGPLTNEGTKQQSPTATKKEKIEARKQAVRDQLGAKEGDTIIPSDKIGYSSANEEYKIESIDNDGTVWVRNTKTQGRTSWSRADLSAAKSRGVKFETPAVVDHASIKDEISDARAARTAANFSGDLAEANRQSERLKQAKDQLSKAYASDNKIFTADAAEKARALIKSKLGTLNTGIDPELMQAGITLAGYHIESGARSFSAYSKAMLADLGDMIKPYLKSWYMAVKFDPRAAALNGLSSAAEVDSAYLPATEKVAEKAKPSLDEFLAHRLDTITDNNALKKVLAEYHSKTVSEVTEQEIKAGQESVEAALVVRGREIVADGGDRKTIFDKLLDIYQNQPLLNSRTSTSMANQAYSTPLPLAYLASELAGITSKTTVLEPTAGNGALLIAANPKNTTANEMDETRLRALQAQGFNASQKDAVTEKLRHAGYPVDSVIMNPPFGSLPGGDEKYNGYTFKKIDHMIAARALESMKDSGRAVLIIGANKEAGNISSGDRVFFNWLYSHYNVADHFEVDGKLYGRQGAGWPIVVISINGRQESDLLSPKSGAIERFNSWGEIYNHAASVLDSEGFRPINGTESSAVTADQPASDAGELPQPSSGEVVTPGVRTGSRARQGRSSENNRGAAAEQRADGRNGAGNDRGNTDGERLYTATDQPSHIPANGRAAVAAEPGRDSAGNQNTGVTGDRSSRDRSRVDDPATGSEFQVAYKPASTGPNDAVLVPVNMADATDAALADLEKAVGNIDDYVMQKLGYDNVAQMQKAMMGLQVDTVASAIYNIEQKGKGIIIADQTGVGKGRQAAGIIRYALQNDKIPVFVTVKTNLFSDIYDDALDIGETGLRPFILNGDGGFVKDRDTGNNIYQNKPADRKAGLSAMQGGALPEGRNAIFLTYSQVNTENAQRRALQALADTYGDRLIFIMDEAHNAAGEPESIKKVKGVNVKTVTGAGFWRKIINNVPTIYLSATYAKRPDNMPVYYRTDMMDSVDTPDQLLTAFDAGGEALQTVLANMLARSGQLWRRERSFEGIKIDTIVNSKNKERDTRLADHVTSGLRKIVEADNSFKDWVENEADETELMQSLGLNGGDFSHAGGAVEQHMMHSPFTSVIHNYVRQFILALKADWIIDEAKRLHAEGKKPVIALENTMESFLKEAIELGETKVGDQWDGDYRSILHRALERTRRLSMKMPNGDTKRIPIPLKLLPERVRNEYSDAVKFIDSLELDGIPLMYIDYIRHGLEKSGIRTSEITGRSYQLDYSKPVPVIKNRDSSEIKDRRATVDKFNNGTIDAMILNAAGSTGLSAHASQKFKDKKPRHMLVAQAMLDINILMQMLGRINRTGQVELPGYSMMGLDLPAEKRPLAMANRKMRSLNANTSANTESDTSLNAPDILNKYGDQVVEEYLSEHKDLAAQLNMPEEWHGLAMKFTGRMALLPAKQQEQIYHDIESAYADLIDFLNATGQNDLKAETLDLDAKILSSEVIAEGKDPTTRFGGNTTLHKVTVKRLGRPPSPDMVMARITESLKDQTPKQVSKAITEPRADDAKKLSAKLESQYREAEKEDDKDRLFNLEQQIQKLHESMSEIDSAVNARFKIGARARLDIGDEVVTGMVVNITDKFKPGHGMPSSMGAIRITFAVNSPVGFISLPLSKLKVGGQVFQESLSRQPISKETLANFFRADLASESREQRYIATGNLISGFSKLGGGRVVNFTGADQRTYTGIFMPRKFGKDGTAAIEKSPLIVRDAAKIAAYLRKLNAGDELAKIGAFSQPQAIRITQKGDGQYTISVPTKSDPIGNKIKFDTDLHRIMGSEFAGRGSQMTATVTDKQLSATLAHIMREVPLYIPNSGIDLLEAVGGKGKSVAVQSFDEARPSADLVYKPGEKIPVDQPKEDFPKKNQEAISDQLNQPVTKVEPGGKNDQEESSADTEGKLSTSEPVITYTTKKGKELRGVIIRDMDIETIKAKYDPYAWKMDGGVFVREKHLRIEPKLSLGTNRNFSEAFIEKNRALVDKLTALVKEIAPAAELQLKDRITAEGTGAKLSGGEVGDSAAGSYLQGVIQIALNYIDPTNTAYHEALHALKDAGLFTDKEWRVLERRAEREWRQRYGVESNEEGIAYATADYLQGKTEQFGGQVRRLLERFKQMFERARNLLRGDGFQTWQDVLDRVQSGEVGSRNSEGLQGSEGYSMSPADEKERDSYLTAALRMLADEDLFKFPSSSSKDLTKIFAEIDPGIDIELRPEEAARARTRMGRPVSKVWVAWMPRQVSDDKGGTRTIKDPVRIYEGGGEVWVNAAALKQGISGGSKVYSAVGNYAANAGKVFIGDPDGLSDAALLRRTQHMLSLALKFGRTDFMTPHQKQIAPATDSESTIKTKVRKLDWRDGEHEHNLRELVLTAYHNVVAFLPELKNVRFNPSSGNFVDGNNDVISDEYWHDLENRYRSRLQKAGVDAGSYAGRDSARRGMAGGRDQRSGTLKIAAFAHTFLRQESRAGWRGLLATLSGKLSGDLGGNKGTVNTQLRDTLYSMGADDTEHTGSILPHKNNFFERTQRTAAKAGRGAYQAFLASLPMDKLAELAQDNMRPVTERLETLRKNMDALRYKEESEFSPIADQWSKLNWSQPKQAEAMADVMHMATLWDTDPRKKYRPSINVDKVTAERDELMDGDYDEETTARIRELSEKLQYEEKRRAARDDIEARWADLSLKAKDLFGDAENAYVLMRDRQLNALDNHILSSAKLRYDEARRNLAKTQERIDAAPDMDMEEADKLRKQAEDRKFNAEINYAAVGMYTKAAREHRANPTPDTKAALKEAIADVKNDAGGFGKLLDLRMKYESNHKDSIYFPLARFGDYWVSARNSKGELAAYERAETKGDMEKIAKHYRSEGLSVKTGIDSDIRSEAMAVAPQFVSEVEGALEGVDVPDELREQIWTMYLKTMPPNSLRKRMIRRKGVSGYSNDAFRAYSSQVMNGSRQIAKITYGNDLKNALAELEDRAADAPDQQQARAMVDEYTQAIEWWMNPVNNAIASSAGSLAHAWYLMGSPAAALVNLSQMAQIAMPLMAADYGWVSTTAAIGVASKDFAQGLGHAEKNLTGDEKAAMEVFINRGVIEKTQSFAIADMSEKGSDYSIASHRAKQVSDTLSFLFHHVERFNREITTLAVYRLERDKGTDHKLAMHRAMKMIDDAHFDYSNSNRPRLMRSNTAKFLTTLRNYTVNMWSRLIVDFRHALKASSPADRKRAWIRLGNVYGAFFVTTGVTGLPFIGTALMIANAFKGGDDEDDDFTSASEAFVNGARRYAKVIGGDTLADWVVNGIPGSVLSIDLKGRIGFGDIWFRTENRDMSTKDSIANFTESVLGATAAIGISAWRAADNLAAGNTMKAAEGVVPVFVKNILKAVRFNRSGVETAGGMPVVGKEQISDWDLIKQLIGFTPEGIASAYEQRSQLGNKLTRVQNRKGELKNQLNKAIESGDDQALNTASDNIDTYNSKVPAGLSIGGRERFNSIRARQRTLRNAEGGISMPAKYRDAFDEMSADTEGAL